MSPVYKLPVPFPRLKDGTITGWREAFGTVDTNTSPVHVARKVVQHAVRQQEHAQALAAAPDAMSPRQKYLPFMFQKGLCDHCGRSLTPESHCRLGARHFCSFDCKNVMGKLYAEEDAS